MVSVKTIGRKIDFVENDMAVSTAYFYYAKFHFNTFYQIKTKWTSQKQNAGVDSNLTWQRGKNFCLCSNFEYFVSKLTYNIYN